MSRFATLSPGFCKSTQVSKPPFVEPSARYQVVAGSGDVFSSSGTGSPGFSGPSGILGSSSSTTEKIFPLEVAIVVVTVTSTSPDTPAGTSQLIPSLCQELYSVDSIPPKETKEEPRSGPKPEPTMITLSPTDPEVG